MLSQERERRFCAFITAKEILIQLGFVVDLLLLLLFFYDFLLNLLDYMVIVWSFCIFLFDILRFPDSVLFIAIVVYDDWELVVTVLVFSLISLNFFIFFFFLVMTSILL